MTQKEFIEAVLDLPFPKNRAEFLAHLTHAWHQGIREGIEQSRKIFNEEISKPFAAIKEAAKGLHSAGMIDDKELEEFKTP